MSLPWVAELRLGLAPGYTALARTPRGLGRRTVHARLEAQGLDAALDAQPRERTDLTVVLSNHFVRYALLPGTSALGSAAEWSAYAAHVFEATHGRVARDWTLSVATAGRGQARIASAIDTALLASIRAQVARFTHLRLVSVQPYMAAAFDRARRALGAAPAWVAAVEEGRAVIALVAGGRWLAIRARRIGQAWTDDLHAAIEREEAMRAESPRAERLYVISDAERPHGMLDLGRLRLSDLTLRAGMAPGERRYTLALAP